MCNVWNSGWVKLLKESENIKETDDCMSNKDSGYAQAKCLALVRLLLVNESSTRPFLLAKTQERLSNGLVPPPPCSHYRVMTALSEGKANPSV